VFIPGAAALILRPFFLVALVYGLSVLLGFDINAKRGLLILGILAVLPIAYSVCSPNPSTITIGVPASYTCPAECTTCTSAITCTGCKSGYYLAGSQCYPECSTTCSAGERCVAGFFAFVVVLSTSLLLGNIMVTVISMSLILLVILSASNIKILMVVNSIMMTKLE